MALNNRGGGPDLLSTFLHANNNASYEIKAQQDDDDVSKLSFGDNQSYICDLAMQKKNRKAMIQQEALEETQELYEVAIGEGAQKTKELFMQIFTLVEAELIESYKEKDKLLELRLEAAVEAEKERLLAKVNKRENAEPGPKEQRVSQIDKKIQKEETKILKKKIKKIRNMVKDIMKDKQAMKDDKKSKQLKRLQKKHDNLVEELDKLKQEEDSVLGGASSNHSLDLDAALGAIGKAGDSSDDDSDALGFKKKKKKKKEKQLSLEDGGPGKVSDKPRKKKKSTSSTKGPKGRRKSLQAIDEGASVKSGRSMKKKIGRNTSGLTAKSNDTAETEKTTYTLKEFKKGKVDEDVVNMKKWEEYLTESEFEKAFKMSRSEFKELPKSEQTSLKNELQTW